MNNINLIRRAEIGKKKRARTLDLLLKSAMKCIADDNVTNTTIDDICRTASVSRGTFYNYFNDIDEIIIAALKEVKQIIDAKIEVQFPNLAAGPERMAMEIGWLYKQVDRDPLLAKLVLFAIEKHQSEKFNIFFKSNIMEDLEVCRSRNLITLDDNNIVQDIMRGIIFNGLRSLFAKRIAPEQAVIYVERTLLAIGVPQKQAVSFARFSQLINNDSQDT